MGSAQSGSANIASHIKLIDAPICTFNFKGIKCDDKELYKFNKHCIMCGKQRFTVDDIDILTDPDLTYEQFKEKFPDMDFSNGLVCEALDCRDKLLQYKGRNTDYHLRLCFPAIDTIKWSLDSDMDSKQT